MNQKVKETLLTLAALTAYGAIFLCIIGVILFLLFGVLAVWGSVFDLLS